MLDVELSSRLDTALANLVAVIDLAHARHVQTVTGESYTHSVAPIPSHGVMGTRWCLEVIPHPPRPVDDSIIVRYSAPGWNGERSCMHIVHIIPPTQSVTCALTLPDVTIMPDGRFAPDTIALQWTLSNAGDIPSPAGSARLTLSADSAACIDPFVLPIPALAAKQQTTLTWRLVPRTSAFNRSVGISVAARDSAGRAFADCHARLELPRVFPAVECSLSAPDSLRYLRSSDAYLPDPFTASVSVHNRVDTVDVVDVGIDLSAAPHLGLAAGETGVAALGALAAHDTASAAFRVTVRQAPDVASTERIRTAVTARFGEATIDSECSASIAMEARPKIFTAECYTMGHDTTWADPGNEDMIPHPLQMRLGIINTGNEPIENCAAAIIIPNGYILSQPPDSIQRYASIAPGDTGRREWLMEVNRVNTVPGVSEVRWTWGNGTLSGSCTRSAVLVQGSPVGITLSRWRLLFRAQRNDPAPAAQTVSVWTGGNVPFTWRAASDAWWLDATPNLLSGSKTIQIGPTTTALADGWYEGMVRIVTGEFARPTPIEVGYEIYTTADAETPPQPGGPALWCLPNPSRPGATVQVRYVQRAPGPVRLGLVDALGREAAALQPGSSEAGEHAVTLALPASMSAGAYFLVLEAAEGRVVKGMMVIR